MEFLGRPPTGWTREDEERWDEALGIVEGDLGANPIFTAGKEVYV